MFVTAPLLPGGSAGGRRGRSWLLKGSSFSGLQKNPDHPDRGDVHVTVSKTLSDWLASLQGPSTLTPNEARVWLGTWYRAQRATRLYNNPKAAKASRTLPPIDSINQWPMISGQNLTSPRDELFITEDLLIQGDWKLITGKASSASWAGPTYPNSSSDGIRSNEPSF